MKRIVVISILWLVAINVFALVALNRYNLKPDTAYPWIDPAKTAQVQTWNPIPLHAKWDSFWYLGIARDGYIYKEGQLSNIVFFPTYPSLLRAGTTLLMGNEILAGWIISCIFLVLACIMLYKLAKEFHPNIDPEQAVIFLLIFPTAFFLNTVYTESLFLFLSISVFYFAFKRNFWIAGAIAFIAALTRITGMLLFLPLFFEYFRGLPFHAWLAKIKTDIFAIVLPILGMIAFFAFHWIRFGDPALFFKVESLWGRSFDYSAKAHALLGQLVVSATRPEIINGALDIGFALLAIILSILAARKLRLSYGIYMLATLAIALGGGTTMSINRYILVLFPMFIFASSMKNKNAKYVWAFISILLLALYTLSFVSYYWAG